VSDYCRSSFWSMFSYFIRLWDDLLLVIV